MAKSTAAAVVTCSKSAQEYARELFSEAYITLFDSDTDKGNEILVSLLAKKIAIQNVNSTKELIVFIYESKDEPLELKEILANLNETIKEIEIL